MAHCMAWRLPGRLLGAQTFGDTGRRTRLWLHALVPEGKKKKRLNAPDGRMRGVVVPSRGLQVHGPHRQGEVYMSSGGRRAPEPKSSRGLGTCTMRRALDRESADGEEPAGASRDESLPSMTHAGHTASSRPSLPLGSLRVLVARTSHLS